MVIVEDAWKFIKKWWLPLNFTVVLIIALCAPAPGKAVVSVSAGPFRLVEMINIIIVFLISGFTMNTAEVKKVQQYWHGFLFGCVSILVVTPLLGFAFAAIPFAAPEFGQGLTVFSTAPTTLGVGAALVRSCGGNDSLALLLMTITSLLSVFTSPLWLKVMLGGSANVHFNIGKMFWQLVVTVLVPSLVGKAIRELWPGGTKFAQKYKEYLGMFSVFNLAFIVWQSLSGAQSSLLKFNFGQVLVSIIIPAFLQHVLYLIFNGFFIRYLFPQMSLEDAVAVWIMSSQKSAPVAVTVITYMTNVIAQQGLLSLPCLVGQLLQIFIGSAFAPIVAKKVRATQEARKVPVTDENQASLPQTVIMPELDNKSTNDKSSLALIPHSVGSSSP